MSPPPRRTSPRRKEAAPAAAAAPATSKTQSSQETETENENPTGNKKRKVLPVFSDDSEEELNRKPPAKKKSKKMIQQSKKRGQGYGTEETLFLCYTVLDIIPIGPNEWDEVTKIHLDEFPDQDRDKESLRRKFSKLANAKVPTGDPNCPEEVRLAKRAMREIEDKMESTEEIEEEELGFNNTEEDIEEEEDVASKSVAARATLTSPSPSVRKRRGRPPNIPSQSPHGSSMENMVGMMMQKMMHDSERQEERREERRQQQVLETCRLEAESRRTDMMMMMGMGILSKILGPDGMKQLGSLSTNAKPDNNDDSKNDSE